MNSWRELLSYSESLAVIGGLFVWLIRIEPRMANLEKEATDLKNQQKNQAEKHDALAVEIRSSLSDIKASQARIEGWISGREGKLQ